MNRKVSFNLVENKGIDLLGPCRVMHVKSLKRNSSDKGIRSMTPDPLIRSNSTYYFNKTTRDISHILDNHKAKVITDSDVLQSIYRSSNSLLLPTDYDKVKEFAKSDYVPPTYPLNMNIHPDEEKNANLGPPTGRIQAKNLKK